MIRLILILLLAGSFAAQAQDSRLSLPYSRFTLDNGLILIVHEDFSTPMVAVNVWYHVGSSYEKPGRTGFAHLFEHIMFEGSGNVKEGDFDNLLEGAGGNNNGSTNNDRTNYYETVPANAVSLALFLESDRMGFLPDAMSPGKVDGQRDVVKNERRQSYENRPYGLAWQYLSSEFYPKNHPYHWPVIGYMEDLSAASYEDVLEFYKKYYRPNNAALVIAGAIKTADAKKLAESWFRDVPKGETIIRPEAPEFELSGLKTLTIEDNVQLPRLYMAFKSPRSLSPGDAEMDITAQILAGGKNSRLYKRLVYDLQIAQDVNAFQNSGALASQLIIIATARPGIDLDQLKTVIDEEIEKLKAESPSQRELQRVVNQYEVSYLSQFQSIEAKADMMNSYFRFTGNPDWANEDLSRYKSIDTGDISSVTQTYLDLNKRLILSFVPKGATELAIKTTEVKP